MSMSFKPTILSGALIFGALALATNLGATTLLVGTCEMGLPVLPSIQAAINSAPASGTTTIDICPGMYYEQLTNSKNINLVGLSSGMGTTTNTVILYPPSTGLVQNATDIYGGAVAAQIAAFPTAGKTITVHITNIIVDGTNNQVSGCAPTLQGIYFQNVNASILSSTTRNQYLMPYSSLGGCQSGLGINVESNLSTAPTATISGNSVRGYQKNGITVSGPGTNPPTGPRATISNNYIVGLAATAMNWQAGSTAAENGIQIGYGATGTVSSNVVNDNIWGPDTSSDTGDAASGILVYSSSGITVTGNEVGSAQFGIVAVSDTRYGNADSTLITSNKVVGTQIFDAIDVCSNSNIVKSNLLYGNTQSGVHIDDSCTESGNSSGPSGNSNSVQTNTVTEACAGILLGSGTNTIGTNTFYDTIYNTLSGDSCTPPSSNSNSSVRSQATPTRPRLRPSPYIP